MRALLIIDMQLGMIQTEITPRNVSGVVENINAVARAVRDSAGIVVFIQHDGAKGERFARGADGWPLLPSLERLANDVIVPKSACDSFCNTDLADRLNQFGVTELLVTGWATDFCVDTTIRAAASRSFDITVIADAHTVADREYLDAEKIIEHHHQIWRDLIVPGKPIKVLQSEQIIRELCDANSAGRSIR